MGKIVWKSEKYKYEAIGYLARPGVVKGIRASVIATKVDDFKKTFAGKYDEEFPYPLSKNKWGGQYRITLGDTDGCPESLLRDDRYGNRINDSAFIKDLVLNYGFRFSNKPQRSDEIESIVKKMGKRKYEWFMKGFEFYENFLEDLHASMKEKSLIMPNIIVPVCTKKGKKTSATKRSTIASQGSVGYTEMQLANLGWLGEWYIAKLLKEGCQQLCETIKVSQTEIDVEWFNKGYDESSKWEDKSIKKGCDIIVSTGSKDIYIEVKTSKRNSPYFTMTSNEIKMMRDKGDRYYLIKIDNIENLVRRKKPAVIVYEKPYENLFIPERIKEATFYKVI